MHKQLVSFVRRSSNGTNDQRLNSYWRGIQIIDISIVPPLADTGKSVFIP
jgi:hypothetical protein